MVVTKSGKFKAEDPEDWKWWAGTVPDKLAEINYEGTEIAIFTNQGRLTDAKGGEAPGARLFRSKIEAILRALNLPITLYAACANDNWRKPRIGMWDHLATIIRSRGQILDQENSYLVGDAAGRLHDHTDADRHFSMNVGISFYTPEEFFQGAQSEPWEHKFNPASYYPRDISAGKSNAEMPP